MRERIRKRLREYRADAIQSIGVAVNRTRSELRDKGRTNGHEWYQAINKDNEAGLAKYMDQSAKSIRQVYGPPPKDPRERYDYQQIYDYCNAL